MYSWYRIVPFVHNWQQFSALLLENVILYVITPLLCNTIIYCGMEEKSEKFWLLLLNRSFCWIHWYPSVLQK